MVICLSIEELVIEIQNGKIGLKNELWERIKKIVYLYVGRYADYALKHLSEFDEIVAVAWFGVERAINDYKPEKGYVFNTYLKFNIRNAIAEYFGFRGAKKIKTISLDTPLGDDTEMTICDTIEDEEAQSGFEDVERSMISEFVREQVKSLNPQESQVIQGIFFEGLTQNALAERLEVSFQRIGQLKSLALRRLNRKPVMQDYYKEFCYRHIGYKTFNTTWTSSTEWVVLKIDELTANNK